MKSTFIHFSLVTITTYMFLSYVQLWDKMNTIYIYTKPFVYRTLVPLLADGLMWIGFSREVSYTSVLAFSLIGFILSMKTLASRISKQWDSWILAYVSSWGLFLLVLADAKSYDLMTAFLMTLSFLLIYDLKVSSLLVVFPLVCLNRETAFLVIVFCAAWFWRKIKLENWLYLLTILSVMFFSIQYGIRLYFQDVSGKNGEIYLFQNLHTFLYHPMSTFVLVGCMMFVVGCSFLNWNLKSDFLKIAFLSTFPIIFVLYLVFGFGYEVRVFAEAYPFTFLLITENITCKELNAGS